MAGLPCLCFQSHLARLHLPYNNNGFWGWPQSAFHARSFQFDPQTHCHRLPLYMTRQTLSGCWLGLTKEERQGDVGGWQGLAGVEVGESTQSFTTS